MKKNRFDYGYILTLFISLVVALLIGASFIPGKPEITTGLICLALAALTMVLEAIPQKSLRIFPYQDAR